MSDIIVSITGASGFIYGLKALELLKKAEARTHLIISKGAELSAKAEGMDVRAAARLADKVYDSEDMAAPVASGSFITDGMLIAPCSMRTLSAVATGNSYNLVARAADVMLKERRKLVLMTREAPLSTLHIENMLKVSRMGAVICPPVPAFYTKPATVDDIVTFSVARAIDQFGIKMDIPRWGDT